MKKLISFLETASTELTKFVKKQDLEILAKQINLLK